MNLEVQVECDTLVRQHHAALAQVRKDVADAVLKTAELWEPVFSDPSDMHGQLHCTSVRGLLIKARTDREAGVGLPEGEKPAKGSLTTRCGQGMSAILDDGRGGEGIRVRKAPSKVVAEHDRLVVYPSKAQREAALKLAEAGARPVAEKATADAVDGGEPEPEVVNGQYTFGGEFDQLERKPTGYDWFVLWTLSPDSLHVLEVFLAAVIGIDDSTNTVIVASAPLPKLVARQEDTSDNDFEDFGKASEEGTGPAPA
ncbi:hypothetical protein P5V83_23980 [Mycobacteroides abscessus subsp. abscessus]|uniref:hypothetical protein n=1 Tax=Mycobacteroides abscessus TaxID=36809 RepID=UPI00266B8F06|nr:hypothetical protein [Mycobacteroides abscessus]MDO3002873.1 hypothetical protein [Mycobacteroides abscessus subsp. abscessus]MDO3199297.1 hypothetical protein [Mycobacteroides abscessus subsp. abscessus]MDO3282810.1 hypothetical protein [Mycobacteroides abscessus subsp. abscessus]